MNEIRSGGIFVSKRAIVQSAVGAGLLGLLTAAFFLGAYLELECKWFKKTYDLHAAFWAANAAGDKAYQVEERARLAFDRKDWAPAMDAYAEAASLQGHADHLLLQYADFSSSIHDRSGLLLNAATAAYNAGNKSMCIYYVGCAVSEAAASGRSVKAVADKAEALLKVAQTIP